MQSLHTHWNDLYTPRCWMFHAANNHRKNPVQIISNNPKEFLKFLNFSTTYGCCTFENSRTRSFFQHLLLLKYGEDISVGSPYKVNLLCDFYLSDFLNRPGDYGTLPPFLLNQVRFSFLSHSSSLLLYYSLQYFYSSGCSVYT